ncbi:MAG: glycosyltransferase family 87 protein [Janthinobacterium lividum]
MLSNCKHSAEHASQFPRGLVLYLQLVLFLTVLPFLFLLELYLVKGSFLQARLWSPESDRFGDFWHYRYLLQYLHRPEFFAARDRFAYPAPCAILYQWLYRLGPHPHLSFNIILWAVEGISAIFLLRALAGNGLRFFHALGLVLLMLVTSYPWHTLYDRGNIELFLYIFIAGGVWAWLCGHERVAAVLWGCAGALKLYPLLLIALYAKRGSWRTFLLAFSTCIGILLLSFWYVGPTMKLAASGTMWGIRGFVGTYGAHTRFQELVLDHSFLGGVKEILALPIFRNGDKQIVLSHMYEAVVVVAGPPLFLRWRRTAPAINQLCVLLTLLMLLPPVSYDYTLVYAYLVIGIVFHQYLSMERRGQTFHGCVQYVVAFAVLCTAENWINIMGFEPNGLLKAAALITILITLVRYPLRFQGPGLGSA